MNTKLKQIILPFCLVIVYLFYLYFALTYMHDHGLFIRVGDLTAENLSNKLTYDFFLSLLIIAMILGVTLARKAPLSDLGITKNNLAVVIALFTVNVVLFIIRGDFSVRGFYTFVFYLVIVAFSEEFIFRGYLFTAIHKSFGFWPSAIISGVLWGIPHAFMDVIMNDGSLFAGMANNLGMGIVAGAGFAFVYKKSKTLFVPVLIHSILDYLAVFAP